MAKRKALAAAVPQAGMLGTAGAAGDLSAYVGYGLRRAQLAVFSHFNRKLADLELGPAQFSLLVIVGAHPGLAQSRAAAMLGIHKANFVPFVGKLLRRRLIARVPIDGRTTGLRLTPAGRAALRDAQRAGDAHERTVTRLLSAAEKRRLFELLDRITFAAQAAEARADARRSLSGSTGAPRRGSGARRTRRANDPE